MVKNNHWEEIDKSLQEAVDEGVFPGAVLLGGSDEKIEYIKPAGYLSLQKTARTTEDTVFDVASLTKPVCTVSVVMSLLSESSIRLNDSLGNIFNSVEIAEHLKKITIEDLLSHQSGIRAYVPFYEEIFKRGEGFVGSEASRKMIFERARKEDAEYERGSKFVYSDLGFIILCEVLERITGARLDRVATERVFKKTGMHNTSFMPWKGHSDSDILKRKVIAPTQHYEWLGGEAHGVVHDENCYCMNGVSGHAGLFTTAKDLYIFMCELFKGLDGKSGVFSHELCKKFFRLRNAVKGSPWALGWKKPVEEESSCGDLFGKNSIGHLGFTGCSIWADLDCRLFIILLSNRVNLGRDNIKIRKFRPQIHNKMMKLLKGIR